MVKEIQVAVLPSQLADERALMRIIADELSVNVKLITSFRIKKRSLDARSRQPRINLSCTVYIGEIPKPEVGYEPAWQRVNQRECVLIVGAGPAGLFAALRLIELGLKPVVLERGKDVRSRRRDLAALNKAGIVNPDSNYCFGEGGAGTYSDGKLFTRSGKRGSIKNILNLFHYFGADADILVDAHPHIGTNRLPGIITNMRELIIAHGGEVHFESGVTDLLQNDGRVAGVVLKDGTTLKAPAVVLATGHSARDVFEMLSAKRIVLESKPFALGVRIEHPQQIIDHAVYHAAVRDSYLPPASYSLVCQQGGRGVFSFCMCPGGVIAPAATAPGEIVVNGWSPSKRNNPFANSGTVVTVDEHDFAQYGFTGPLAAMHYQQMVEQACYEAGGGLLVAPAQRLTDFVDGKISRSLPKSSYHPGLNSVSLKEVLPSAVFTALRKAVPEFGRKLNGYYTYEAVMVATESRTSSPVRIPRDPRTLEHVQVVGLYPCGEGAGYAGGIVSAAIDGQRVAEAIAAKLCLTK